MLNLCPKEDASLAASINSAVLNNISKMRSGKCMHGFDVDPITREHIIPKPEPKPEPIKYKQSIDYVKEIDRLYKEKFPEKKEQPKPKINEIRKLSRLLQDYRYG